MVLSHDGYQVLEGVTLSAANETLGHTCGSVCGWRSWPIGYLRIARGNVYHRVWLEGKFRTLAIWLGLPLTHAAVVAIRFRLPLTAAIAAIAYDGFFKGSRSGGDGSHCHSQKGWQVVNQVTRAEVPRRTSASCDAPSNRAKAEIILRLILAIGLWAFDTLLPTLLNDGESTAVSISRAVVTPWLTKQWFAATQSERRSCPFRPRNRSQADFRCCTVISGYKKCDRTTKPSTGAPLQMVRWEVCPRELATRTGCLMAMVLLPEYGGRWRCWRCWRFAVLCQVAAFCVCGHSGRQRVRPGPRRAPIRGRY